MMERNVTMSDRPVVRPNASLAQAPGQAPGPVSRVAGLPLTTPLVWAWGGVLLTASTWLVGVIALFRGFAGLFD